MGPSTRAAQDRQPDHSKARTRPADCTLPAQGYAEKAQLRRSCSSSNADAYFWSA
jgi:hypothetical protein